MGINKRGLWRWGLEIHFAFYHHFSTIRIVEVELFSLFKTSSKQQKKKKTDVFNQHICSADTVCGTSFI